jgi:hypothetical protein
MELLLASKTPVYFYQTTRYHNYSSLSISIIKIILPVEFREIIGSIFRESYETQISYLFIYGCTVLVDLGRFFSFLIYTQSVGLLGRGISPSQGNYLHREQHKHRINAHRHTPMPRVGFEPTILVFERAKTVHALARAATVTGTQIYC